MFLMGKGAIAAAPQPVECRHPQGTGVIPVGTATVAAMARREANFRGDRACLIVKRQPLEGRREQGAHRPRFNTQLDVPANWRQRQYPRANLVKRRRSTSPPAPRHYRLAAPH